MGRKCMNIPEEQFEFLKNELTSLQKEVRYLKKQDLLTSIKNHIFNESERLMKELDSIDLDSDCKPYNLEYERKSAQVTIVNDILREILNLESDFK